MKKLTHKLTNKTILSKCLLASLLSSTVAFAGDDSTMAYDDIENPWVHYDGEHVDWNEYAKDTFSWNGNTYKAYSKIKGEGVDSILDWTSGSFLENETNRERYVEHFVNEFDLDQFNSETGHSFDSWNVRAVQIMIYNNGTFTQGDTAVWANIKGVETEIVRRGKNIVEEEVLDVMAILPWGATQIRIGYKASGEINGNWKKCDWVNLGGITGAVFRSGGALYNKKCYHEYDDNKTTTSEQYSYGAKVWGGSGGDAFNDITALGNGIEHGDKPYITKIGLRSGARIDQVSLEYSHGLNVSHGGNGGSANSISLPSGTTLQQVEICKNYTSKHDSTTVHYIKFTLSNGSTLAGGTKGGDCTTLKSNKGYPTVGFRGRSGNELDSLGIIIEQPVTGDL